MASSRVLFVDDDSDALIALTRAVSSHISNLSVSAAANVEKALQLAHQTRPQVAVIDLSISAQEGVESGFGLIRKLREQHPECRIVVLTGHDSAEFGVKALTLGAASFLGKPADVQHLAALIRDGISQSELRSAFRELSELRSRNVAGMFSTRSARMQEVVEALHYAAQTNQAVLISGETGTGKGVCAQLLHSLSARSAAPFVRYQPNYANSDLVNSDLFGHQRGAFTGALDNRRGLLAEAWGGTLFLDEIDELPNETQVALLGVLQDRRYRALGASTEMEANFRLVCATNCDLRVAVEHGKIRRDFFHRIAHFEIKLPALRERKDDLESLAQVILRRISEREGLSQCELENQALNKLQSYDWPGNVRELEAVLEGASYRAQFRSSRLIESCDLRIGLQQAHAEGSDFHTLVHDYKIGLIQKALARHAGNQVRAAEELGLDRTTLRRLLSRQP